MIDLQTVKAMRQAEEAAFASCYQQLSGYIYTIIFRICGNESVAEEIMQDSFIHGFNKLEQLKNDEAFTPWLKRIAFNKTMLYLRQSQREVTIEQEHLDTLLDSGFSEQLVAENQLAYLLTHLTAQEKLVIWMFVVEGYSHQEIADLCDKTVSFSKSIVSRSLAKLRDIDKQ